MRVGLGRRTGPDGGVNQLNDATSSLSSTFTIFVVISSTVFEQNFRDTP
jgi:hypothetical protein